MIAIENICLYNNPYRRRKDLILDWKAKGKWGVVNHCALLSDGMCFFTGMILQGITSNSAPMLNDIGLQPSFVATVLSVNSLALSFLKLFAGFVYDKRGLRFAVSMCMITGVIVIFLLTVITNSSVGMVLAIIYGVFAALAVPLETVILPIIAADLFGQHSYNKILGIIVSVNTVGYAVGSPLTNLCYDLTGNYLIALYQACGLMIAVVIAMQFVICSANTQRSLIMETIQCND